MLLTAGAMGDDNRVPFLSPIQPKSKKAPTRFHAVALSVEAALLCQNFRFLRQLLTMQIVVPPPRQRLCPGKANAKIAKGANSSVAASAGKKPKASGHYKKGERKRKGEWARMLGKARLEGWEEGRKIVQAMKAAPPPHRMWPCQMLCPGKANAKIAKGKAAPPPRRRLCPGTANAKIAKGANSSVVKSVDIIIPKATCSRIRCRKGQGTKYLQNRLERAAAMGRAEVAASAAVTLNEAMAVMGLASEVAEAAVRLAAEYNRLMVALRQAEAVAQAAEARVAMVQEASDAAVGAAEAAGNAAIVVAVAEERRRVAAALAHAQQRHRECGAISMWRQEMV